MPAETTTTLDSLIIGSRTVRGASQPVSVRLTRYQSGRCVTWFVQTVCGDIPETSESFKRLSGARAFYGALVMVHA
jgi:hypothetical protein